MSQEIVPRIKDPKNLLLSRSLLEDPWNCGRIRPADEAFREKKGCPVAIDFLVQVIFHGY